MTLPFTCYAWNTGRTVLPIHPTCRSCPTCLVVNAESAVICPCCETRNPRAPKADAAAAAPPSSAPATISFGFGSSATAPTDTSASAATPAPTFSFGFGGASTAASAPISFGFGGSTDAVPATAAFNFGVPAAAVAPAPAAEAKPDAAAPKRDKNAANDEFFAAEVAAIRAAESASGAPGTSTDEALLPHVEYEYARPLPMEAPATLVAAAAPLAKRRRGARAAAATPSVAEVSAAVTEAPTSTTTLTVFVAGSGECEQLGLGPGAYAAETFLPVPRLTKLSVARLAVGGLHTLALTVDGALWSWGCNDDSALGRSGAENVPGRVRVGPDAAAPIPLVSVAAGDSHSVGVDAAGRVWAWGTYKGADGYLGFGGEGNQKKAERPVELASVHGVYGPVARVSSGADHTAALTRAGLVVAWGFGGQGQLGKLTTARELRGGRAAVVALTPYPIHVRRPRGVPAAAAAAANSKRRRGGGGGSHSAELLATAVFCVGYSTFIVTTDGGDAAGGDRVFACGLNNYGQLGLGDAGRDVSLPEEVEPLRGVGIVAMAGGAAHTLALDSTGRVWAWGRGDSGQLGLSRAPGAGGIPVASASFVPLAMPASRFGGHRVVAVSANSCSSAAVTADGGLYAWGFGESGQLGTGRGADENVPVRVMVGALAGARVVAVGVGGQHSVVLAEGGAAAAAAIAAAPAGATDIVEDPVVAEDDGDDDDDDDEVGDKVGDDAEDEDGASDGGEPESGDEAGDA